MAVRSEDQQLRSALLKTFHHTRPHGECCEIARLRERLERAGIVKDAKASKEDKEKAG